LSNYLDRLRQRQGLGSEIACPFHNPPKPRWHHVQIALAEGMEVGILQDSEGILRIVVRAPGQPWPHDLVPRECVAVIPPGIKTYRVEAAH